MKSSNLHLTLSDLTCPAQLLSSNPRNNYSLPLQKGIIINIRLIQVDLSENEENYEVFFRPAISKVTQ